MPKIGQAAITKQLLTKGVPSHYGAVLAACIILKTGSADPVINLGSESFRRSWLLPHVC